MDCDSRVGRTKFRTRGFTGSYQATSTLEVPRPQSQFLDAAGPLRRASTLEGRTRYICDTPSKTRASWLSRTRSPSSNSSSIFPVNSSVHRAHIPNSISDGALMKRLVPEAGSLYTGASAHLCKNPSTDLSAISASTSADLLVTTRPPLSVESVTLDRLLSHSSFDTNEPCSACTYDQPLRDQFIPKFRLSSCLVPRSHTSPSVHSSSVKPKETSCRSPLCINTSYTSKTPRRKTVSISEPTELPHLHTPSLPHAKPHAVRHFDTTQHTAVPELSDTPAFTRHMLSAAGDHTNLTKPGGGKIQYPLHTWFATSQPDTFDPEFESDRPKPTVGAPTRSSVVEPTRGYLEFAIPSERLPHKFDRSNGHAIPSAYSALHPSPSVPAGVISGTSRQVSRVNRLSYQSTTRPPAPLATEEAMNNSSGDTDSSTSGRHHSSFIIRRPQPASKREPLKNVDTRRTATTTPRQLKQQKSVLGSLKAKSTPSESNLTDLKSITSHHRVLTKAKSADYALPPGCIVKPHPSELASTLFRTASLHIRSTLFRLKRSNSGHSTTKHPQMSSLGLRERRASDPFAKPMGNEKSEIDFASSEKEAEGHLDAVSKEPDLDNALGISAPYSKEPVSPVNESPLPPGCSRWSTRLDPPPPVSTPQPVPRPKRPLALRHLIQPSSNQPEREREQPCLHSAPLASQDASPDWKPRPLGSAFCSLPLGQSDELNILTDDCVDFGELGRINYRTGSFMGRYPHGQRSQRFLFPTAQHLPQRTPMQRALTPVRLSPNRSFYLSPYQPSSSGNTTRSAPSPVLPSMNTAVSPLGQDPSFPSPLPIKNLTCPPSRMSATVSIPINRRPNASALSQPVTQTQSSFLELDPVLDRLLSDVSSIDEYRSALRPQGAPLQPRSVKSSWLYPVRVGQSTPAFEVAVDSNGKQSPLRSSDPGSIALSDGHPDPHATHTLSSGTAPVDDDRWDLRRQINDLIQLEFACQLQRRAPTTHIAPEDQSPDRATEDATQARLSDSSIAPESTEPTSGGAFGPRARYHPFRWSSGAHTGRHGADRSTGAVHPGRTHPRSYASHRPRKAASVMAAETGSVDRLTSSADKRVPIVTEPTTSMTDEPSVLDTRLSPELWSSGPDYGSAVSMWSLNANQLATLRQLSLVQLTTLAEKHCVNRSPFTWRFLKYRGANNSGDSTSPYAGVSPHSHKRPDLHVSGPCVPITTSVCSSSGTETHPANSSTTTASLQQPHTEFQHRTAYDGPVFGQSLESWQRRLGCPLPLAISRMMDHISLVGVSAHGIFRRPGGKVRTQALRQKIESDLCWGDFEEWQPYDVADLLKQFFRELPECLLTDKLSMILINIYSCVSEPTQLSILRWVLFGLPDENRAVLQRLLYLLNGLVRHSDVTQMNESNLAVCFAPSLFRFANSCGASLPSVGLSPRRLRRTTSGPDPKDLADQRTAQQCLASMIRNAPFLFEISIDLLRRAHLFPSPLEPPDLESVFPSSDWPTWLQAELGRLARECSGGKSRGWTIISRDAWKAFQSGSGAGEVIDSLEVHYRKAVCTNNSKSGSHLRTWRCSLVIPVNDPQTILEKYSTSRAQWDPEVTQMQIVEQISDCVDLCLITHCSIFPQPKRWFHVLRGHQSLLEDGSCALVCESVAPTGSVAGPFGQDFTFGHIYQDHLYIRPRAEEDGCRVYFISKVDVNGHNPDWYVRHWGHTLVRRLLNLRRSFLPAESNQPVERRNHALLTQPGLSPPSISTNSAVR